MVSCFIQCKRHWTDKGGFGEHVYLTVLFALAYFNMRLSSAPYSWLHSQQHSLYCTGSTVHSSLTNENCFQLCLNLSAPTFDLRGHTKIQALHEIKFQKNAVQWQKRERVEGVQSLELETETLDRGRGRPSRCRLSGCRGLCDVWLFKKKLSFFGPLYRCTCA